MPSLTVKGDWSNTKSFLDGLQKKLHFSKLDKYGVLGVAALAAATPYRTGLTASSWNYEIVQNGSDYRIEFTNSNVHQGRNIAVLIDSGHGTRNGYYISGRNYIDPALDPVLEQIVNSIKEEVSRL